MDGTLTGTGAGTLPSPSDTLGKGHPNIFLQVDFAEVPLQWYVRVETLVPCNSDSAGMAGRISDPRQWESLANELIGMVPSGAGDQKSAQHMVAAAFGFEFDAEQRKVYRP